MKPTPCEIDYISTRDTVCIYKEKTIIVYFFFYFFLKNALMLLPLTQLLIFSTCAFWIFDNEKKNKQNMAANRIDIVRGPLSHIPFKNNRDWASGVMSRVGDQRRVFDERVDGSDKLHAIVCKWKTWKLLFLTGLKITPKKRWRMSDDSVPSQISRWNFPRSTELTFSNFQKLFVFKN